MSRALALVVLALCAAGCLKSESSPMGPSGTASFQGTWTGQWARTACSETGGGGTSCAGLPQTGFLEARLTQSGTAVTGQLEIETFIVSVTGQVGGDGALTLSGQGRFVTVTVTLASWRTTSDGSALTGSFTFVITPDDPGFGVTTAQASLQNVTKTA